jgi:hypothetical protein
MTELAELLTKCQRWRDEIATVTRALPPIEEIVASRLAEFDRGVAQFNDHPFRFGVAHLGAAPSAPAVERLVEHAFGALFPAETRRMIETAARETASKVPGLRLSAADKSARLEQLASELRTVEATAELLRRKIDRETGETLPRTGDAGIWLLVSNELETIATERRQNDGPKPRKT